MTGHDLRAAVEVVAAVIERDGKILVTRRRAGTHLAGFWEFPGGKPEPGESAIAALQREIREELGASVSVGEVLETVDWYYPDKRVRLVFFRCAIHGDPCPLEGQEMAWVTPAELAGREFPPADAILVSRLAAGERVSASTTGDPLMALPIDQQITFLPTSDLAATSRFYEEMLGLPLALDQGTCRVYRVTAQSYIGFCQSGEAPSRPGNTVTLTLVTQEVDQWHARLAARGVEIEKPPQLNPRFAIYHCFLRDPSGYLIEIQRFEDPRWTPPAPGSA